MHRAFSRWLAVGSEAGLEPQAVLEGLPPSGMRAAHGRQLARLFSRTPSREVAN